MTSPCEVKSANIEKTPLRAGFQDRVVSLCQFLSISDVPDPDDKPKRDFGAKIIFSTERNLDFDENIVHHNKRNNIEISMDIFLKNI